MKVKSRREEGKGAITDIDRQGGVVGAQVQMASVYFSLGGRPRGRRFRGDTTGSGTKYDFSSVV